MSGKKYLIIIGGPTASGKTSLAIELAKTYQTSIISCDSRQFFREMSIGTAKPSSEELQQAPHHFVGHLSINDTYTVGDFERDALQLLNELYKENELVIVVGGSGLYIKALCEGLDNFPEVDESIRNELETLYQQKGLSALQTELKKVDPVYYDEVDLNNPHRLIRALSVYRSSGKAFSSFRSKSKQQRPFTPVYLQIHWNRELLYERINKRVDLMLTEGLLEEARSLYPFKQLNALQTVGYQELFQYFDGKLTLDEAVELIKRNSRRYAKRQLTWNRKSGYWKQFTKDEIELCKQYLNHLINHDIVLQAEPLETTEQEKSLKLGFWQGTKPLASADLYWTKKDYGIIIRQLSEQTFLNKLFWHELLLRAEGRHTYCLAKSEQLDNLQNWQQTDTKPGLKGFRNQSDESPVWLMKA
jgi:tRNA dimethylallyltransferase